MKKSVALLFLFCTAIFAQQKGTFADPRDGKRYRTVKIGEQTWIAENLNYNASGSECYDNEPANCDKYGRLYDWNTAMALPSSCNYSFCDSQIGAKHRGICPTGWHIPSNDDWDKLYCYAYDTDYASSSYDCPMAVWYLKATSGRNDYNGSSGNGFDTYWFVALPGGRGYSDGSFSSAGYDDYWWSASESEDYANDAYYRDLYYYYEIADWLSDNKNSLLSVRCVGD